MAEKEGGDSEKKMTKDFLDRWKKIASKYEGPEEAQGAKKTERGPESPRTPTTEEALDRFLANIGQKEEKPGTGTPEYKGPQDLDELLAEFGLDEAERAAPARPEEPKPRAKSAARAPEPEPSPDDSQRRVLETLRKVGLVGTGPPSAVVPTKKPAAPPAPAAPSFAQAPAKPLAPPKHAVAPPLRPPVAEEEEEDSLMLELEALLTDEGPAEGAGPGKAEAGPPKREAFEEEDLIAELEGLLEGDNEVEEGHEEEPALALPFSSVPEPAPLETPSPPALAPAPPALPPGRFDIEEITAPALPPTMVVARAPEPSAPITPPAASLQRPAIAPQTTRPGRVNGGRVNGGRVNGGRVNGGRVNGGRVNGGRVNGGRVNGGRVNGGRLDEGRVNGGRVNGGRVNGGRVNGGRVNGGRVNGGHVNGGHVNGGRVNGGRSRFAGMLPPILVQENRRSRMIRLAVASIIGASLFAGLLAVAPFGGGPRGPAADGDTQDWVASGALFYQDTQDASLPSALDLREYAIRTEGNPPNRLWFEASTSSALFSRPSGAQLPARGDLFTLLIDVDGSSATGYAYHDLGVDRTVEVSGWDGLVKSTSTKTFGPRPADDYAGFEPVGGLQVAVKDARIEGVLTGIPRVDPGARAAFELRGVDATGAVRADGTQAPATLRGASLSATVTPICPGILQPGSTTDTPMLSVRLSNPSQASVEVTSLRVTARYAPQVPAQAVGAAVWRDTNQNGVPEGGSDVKLTPASSVLPQQTPTTLSFAAVSISAGGSLTLLVTVDQVPASLAAGSSVVLSIDAASDIAASSSAAVSLLRAPVAAGAQPGAYVASAPSAVAVDGITLDWAGRPTVPDPAADVADAHTDLTQLSANVTASQVAVLVSLSASPMDGAIVPVRLPSTQVFPSTGGGSPAPPVIAPPNLGTDVLFVMIEADNDAGTGYLAGGRGYDYALRVEGKDHRVIPGGAKILQWQGAPLSTWAELPQVPLVGLGANAIELAAAIPPLSLVARNVSVLAYATDWQGLRDDLATPLVIANNQGSRGQEIPDTPASRGGLEPVQPPAALVPEFQDVLAPVAGVLSLVALSGRRRRAPLLE